MIGRFKYRMNVPGPFVRGERVIVERGLYCDTFLLSELEILPPTQPSK